MTCLPLTLGFYFGAEGNVGFTADKLFEPDVVLVKRLVAGIGGVSILMGLVARHSGTLLSVALIKGRYPTQTVHDVAPDRWDSTAHSPFPTVGCSTVSYINKNKIP